MMRTLPRRRLLWVLMVVVAAIIVVLVMMYKNNDQVAVTSIERPAVEKHEVDVTFSDTANRFSDTEQQLIIESLNRQLKGTSAESGTVRSGSYSESIIDNTPIKQALIDVPSVKRTYLIYKADGGAGGQNILYVRCAPKESQFDPSWECIDETE